MLKRGDIRGMTLFTEVIIVASKAFITNTTFGCDVVLLTTIAGNDDLFRIRLRRILLVDGGIWWTRNIIRFGDIGCLEIRVRSWLQCSLIGFQGSIIGLLVRQWACGLGWLTNDCPTQWRLNGQLAVVLTQYSLSVTLSWYAVPSNKNNGRPGLFCRKTISKVRKSWYSYDLFWRWNVI